MSKIREANLTATAELMADAALKILRQNKRIKELEKALQEVLDSGLLNGPYSIHDEIRFIVFEALTKQEETND